jgi:transcriptional pleiotropic regulator of transition state genes
MKATGIVRKIDELGRIVIPKEIRDKRYIDSGDQLEIYVDEDAVIIKKFQAVCIFCGKKDELTEFSGRSICSACVSRIKQEL